MVNICGSTTYITKFAPRPVLPNQVNFGHCRMKPPFTSLNFGHCGIGPSPVRRRNFGHLTSKVGLRRVEFRAPQDRTSIGISRGPMTGVLKVHQHVTAILWRVLFLGVFKMGLVLASSQQVRVHIQLQAFPLPLILAYQLDLTSPSSWHFLDSLIILGHNFEPSNHSCMGSCRLH